MVLTEDDSILHPEINQDTLLYITHLNEGHQTYTRFFDALLINRDQHRSFFHDLRAFRSQPRAIALLQNAAEKKKCYRETITVYLDSRFAHPWCRKTPMKKAFWRAEWGSIQGKQRDLEIVKEEERLHKLLVPIWIIMRSKMFLEKEVVRKWCEQERQRAQQKQENKLTIAALRLHDEQSSEKQAELRLQSDKPRAVSDSGLDEDQREAAAHAATSMLRLAAAGVILSHTPKRKLRWLTKKPS